MKLKENKIFIFIILVLGIGCLIKVVSKDSYAYYSGSHEIPILSTKIGNFAKSSGEGLPSKVAGADLSVQIYLQDRFDSKKYNLSTNMPVYGYHLNEEMSNCTPSKEELTYSNYSLEDGVIKFTVQDEGGKLGPKQIACHIYYDKDKDSDIAVYVLVQDEDFGLREYDGKHYRFVKSIVNLTGYSYYKAECSNPDGATITGYNDGKFSFTSGGPNTCYAYFDKESEE